MALQGKDLGALVGQMGMDIKQWEESLQKMEQGISQVEKKVDSTAKRMADSFNAAGKKMQQVGRTMTTRITLPLAGIAGGALKLEADFDQSMRKITGLVGIASDEVEQMRGRVLELGGQTARSPQELADALFFVTSAGLRGTQALEVLEMSAKASAAGLGETKTVADLVTSAMNAYGAENLSAAQATDVLVGAVREGKAEAAELAGSMGVVLPIASELGVTFDQVGAATAAMTRTGTNAAMAATQLRAIMVGLLKPSQQAEEALASMGTSSAQLREQLREKGLVSVLGFLRDQMQENEQAMAQVFPNVRALAGALDLMGANAEENVGIFDRMKDTTGLNEQAFDAAKGPAFEFQQALTELKTAGIELGRIMMPVARDLISRFTEMVRAFRLLDEQSQRNIIRFGVIAASIGPILIGLGSMARGVSVLIRVGLKLQTVIKGLIALQAATWFGAIATAIALMTTKIIFANKRIADFRKSIEGLLEMDVEGTDLELDRVVNKISEIGSEIERVQKRASRGLIEQGQAEFEIAKLQEQAMKLADLRTRIIEAQQARKDDNETAQDSIDINEELTKIFGNQATTVSTLGQFISENTDRYDAILNKVGELTQAEILEAAALQRQTERIEEQIKARIDLIDIQNQNIQSNRSLTESYEETMHRIAAAWLILIEGAEKLPDALQHSAERVIDISNEMEAQLISSIVNMSEAFFEGVANMAFAGDSMTNVWQSLLSVLADLAIRVGSIAVATGIAIEGIKKALQSLNPAVAIAGGLALIALGSGVKAALSNAARGSSGGSAVTPRGPTATSVPAGAQEVVFRIGNNELIGSLQQAGVIDQRVGKRRNIMGS